MLEQTLFGIFIEFFYNLKILETSIILKTQVLKSFEKIFEICYRKINLQRGEKTNRKKRAHR